MSKINQIIQGLYISSYDVALDKNTIDELNIKTIVNCTCKDEKLDNITYLRIPINDPPLQEDIVYVNTHYQNIVQYIDNKLMMGNVLVHCQAGSQRSATIVAIYLMMKYNMTASNAISLIKSKRPICFFGNVSYRESLTHVQNQLFK